MFHRLVLRRFIPYVFSAILLQSFVQATNYDCPPTELVEPCTCNSRAGVLDIHCNGITYYRDLENVFNRLDEDEDEWKFNVLSISGCSMLYIPSVIFEKAEFRTIGISGSTLTSLFDTTPISVKYIKEFEILDSTFQQGINWKYFQNFELDNLEIQRVIIRELGKEFKKYVGKSNIGHIDFLENGMYRLTDQPFENFQNLKILSLDSQYFKNLEPLILPHSLTEISLRGNSFRSLPDNFFGERWQLAVRLENNQLTSFPKAVFGGVTSVMAEGNPFECTCGMKWIAGIKNRYSGQCASPSTVRGKELDELSGSDFDYCS